MHILEVVYLLGLCRLNYAGVMMYGCEHFLMPGVMMYGWENYVSLLGMF
jgi:hypothetical protein